MATPTVGSTDILCSYGGDISFDAFGKLQTVRDTPGNPAATQQRITVILMQSPRLFDLEQAAVGRPDDLFHPDLGAGLRAIVGQRPMQSLEDGVKARVMSALSLDTAIAQSPAPIVTVTSNGPYYTVSVTAFTASGDQLQVTHTTGG
jgi:hypothetical protein